MEERMSAFEVLLLSIVVLPLLAVVTSPFVRVNLSDNVVSGIVYNTSTNNFISGNTSFSVRASVDTYTKKSNESTFCLPKGSKYEALVIKAAEDKGVRVKVHESKIFKFPVSPWYCADNVTVEVANKL